MSSITKCSTSVALVYICGIEKCCAFVCVCVCVFDCLFARRGSFYELLYAVASC